MTNEWNEFIDYTAKPVYSVRDKKDMSFLGRFTMDMIRQNIGFGRIFTVIARGYLFHFPDGSLRDGVPYTRVDIARRALCAWCSVPERKNATPKEEWQFKTDFRELSAEFPELVDAEGNGWYVRHVKGICNFVASNPGKVNAHAAVFCDEQKVIIDAWQKKVQQFQVSLYAMNTKSEWLTRFDDAVADALELGPLRRQAVELPDEVEQRIHELTPEGIPFDVVRTLVAYYIANKPDDTDWCVLPVSNIEAYLHSNSLSRKYLPKLPKELIERKETQNGVCLYRVKV